MYLLVLVFNIIFMYLDQSMVLEYRPHMELVFLFQTLMDALSSLHDKDKFHNCCRQFLLNSKLHHHSCKVRCWVHRYILNLCRFSSNSKMDIPLHILFDIWFMHYGKSAVIKHTKGDLISEGIFYFGLIANKVKMPSEIKQPLITMQKNYSWRLLK